ncbi:helix-turn-helix domain-containing protein [Sphingobacterium thalpophilum]|uniref:helix-turn-helix domain-containing protein n=1 Tax=Sphingobacterium thalpophilum TaxID=259 RepID=UPI003D951919
MSGAKDKISEYHLNKHQPKKPQFVVHDLAAYIEQHSEDVTHPHIHSFYQIIWFKRGSGKHFVDFSGYPVAENSIFFVAKDQVHYFDDKKNYEGVLIHFNEQFFVHGRGELEFFLKCNLFDNNYQAPYCRLESDTGEILDQYLLLIREELGDRIEDRFGSEELLRAYLVAFLIQVQRQKNLSERVSGMLSYRVDDKKMQLLKFLNLVDKHYTKGTTVTQYAQNLFISTRTLSALTNRLLGKNPSSIVQERIILEAQRLLLHSELNVSQIAFRLGFDDTSYFVKYFKKHTQISPAEFRKSIQ